MLTAKTPTRPGPARSAYLLAPSADRDYALKVCEAINRAIAAGREGANPS